MSAISCLLPSFVMRALDCLDSPVDEPDEEHATALVLNAKERMEPRLENANSVRDDGRTLPASVQRERICSCAENREIA